MAAGTAAAKVCREVAAEEEHVVQVGRPTAVGEEDTGLEEVGQEHPTVAGEEDTGPPAGIGQAEGTGHQEEGHPTVAVVGDSPEEGRRTAAEGIGSSEAVRMVADREEDEGNVPEEAAGRSHVAEEERL